MTGKKGLLAASCDGARSKVGPRLHGKKSVGTADTVLVDANILIQNAPIDSSRE